MRGTPMTDSELPADSAAPAAPPATFEFLAHTLFTQALMALGRIPNPITRQSLVNMATARHFVDMLAMLEKKTAGNLTADEARMLGLKGWVRNLPDGRVEAVFEGEKSAVGQMLLWCAHGPPGAEVTDLETRWVDASSEFKSFDII